MEFGILLGVMGLVGGGIFALKYARESESLRIWRAAVEEMGWTVDPRDWGTDVLGVMGPAMSAHTAPPERRWIRFSETEVPRAGGGALYALMFRHSEHITATHIVMEILATFRDIKIRGERGSHGRALDVETGDAAFDEMFLVTGSPARVLAMLDAEVRRDLQVLHGHHDLTLGGGRLHVVVPQVGALSLARILRQMNQIAIRMSRNLEVPEALAANARQDPHAAVRLQNLLALLREFPEHPAAREALRHACSDVSPEVRFRAASATGGDAGQQILLALARDPEVDDTCKARAIYALGRAFDAGQAADLLAHSLSGARIGTARACIEALGASGAAAAPPALERAMRGGLPEVAAAAARALGAAGDNAVEPILIGALHHRHREVQVAAAEALGICGGLAAVLPLKESARESGDRELVAAVRQAVAEIQARIGGGAGQLSLSSGEEAGRLSIAGAESGELSMTRDDAGRLSVAVTDRGQVSIPPKPRGPARKP